MVNFADLGWSTSVITGSALKTLRDAGTYKQLELGLHWFNQAFSTQREEDKILAFVVALESTILRELRGDLTYRLKLRGLCLANVPTSKASSTGAFLSALYRCRSEISHQGVSLGKALGTVYRKKTPPSEREFLDQARDLVAILLTRCITELASGKTLNGLMNEVDITIERDAAQG